MPRRPPSPATAAPSPRPYSLTLQFQDGRYTERVTWPGMAPGVSTGTYTIEPDGSVVITVTSRTFPEAYAMRYQYQLDGPNRATFTYRLPPTASALAGWTATLRMVRR